MTTGPPPSGSFLSDGNGKRLEVGDELPDAVFVRLEIERSPGTTGQLYTAPIMKRVFLSRTAYPVQASAKRTKEISLKVVKPDRLWAAGVRVPKPPTTGETRTLYGHVYVYYGRSRTREELNGSCHYAICYTVFTVNNRIAAGSDVSMGVRYWNHTVPLKEWFHHEPIPVVKGKNTTDPKLLGIPEHQKKTRSGSR